MQTDSPSLRNDVKAIGILFYALVAGIVIFAILVTGINLLQAPAFQDKDTARVFLIVAIVAAVVCQVTAHVLYRKGLAKILFLNLSLKEKLNQYQAVLIQYLALCEGPALFSLIIYFLTGNYLLLIITFAMLLFMFMKQPQKSKIFNELQLNTTEQMELN